ncbi:hypothetical protein [Foetidibacter luteolus]|uniref:hypothetical protein n=1 Tax=Foetidibacter luteolus TaxID=2608880 RepID=UPI00129A9871|nr:hypothetical protein [Foetidibacter luteolus]
MKDFEPLYELLATIVHMDFADPRHALTETIPALNHSVISMFGSLPLQSDTREVLREKVMWYIFDNVERLEAIGKDIHDKTYEMLDAYVYRYQVDVERTRIFLDLYEHDPVFNKDYHALDF